MGFISSNEGACPSPRGIMRNKVKIYWLHLKKNFKKHLKIQKILNEGQCIISRGKNSVIIERHWRFFKNLL